MILELTRIRDEVAFATLSREYVNNKRVLRRTNALINDKGGILLDIPQCVGGNRLLLRDMAT